MRFFLRWSMATSVLLAVASVASSAGAQDHVNVTISAPTLGTIPRLAADSFDITNQNNLVMQTVGLPGSAGEATKVTGSTEPVKVEIVLPWGGEAAQLVRAMTSGSVPSVIDQITCDFVHAGSAQPYYTVVIDHPLIGHLILTYDSAAAVASEHISIESPAVEYRDGSASTAATPATPTTLGRTVGVPRAMVGRAATLPRLRLVVPHSIVQQLAIASGGSAAGPPVMSFASFAPVGSSTLHFAPEASFPPWATGAMAGVSTLSLTFSRDIISVKRSLPDGTQAVVPVYQTMQPSTARFTKVVGSLSPSLQAAVSSLQPVATTFELADAPSRLGYRVQFARGMITSDHISMSNGHALEQVTVAGSTQVQLTDLRRNITGQAN